MGKKSLGDYCKSEYNKGKSLRQIEKELLKKGHSQKEIDSLFDSMMPETAQEKKPFRMPKYVYHILGIELLLLLLLAFIVDISFFALLLAMVIFDFNIFGYTLAVKAAYSIISLGNKTFIECLPVGIMFAIVGISAIVSPILTFLAIFMASSVIFKTHNWIQTLLAILIIDTVMFLLYFPARIPFLFL